ncbi:MAG: hypothetical protein LRY71_16605, partial [Bacillaceae bacterium]|nr:hypothetical protein [Bacillaceae bacterium]
ISHLHKTRFNNQLKIIGQNKNDKIIDKPTILSFLCLISPKVRIDPLVFASFSNTPRVFFQGAAFYQIWKATVFHDTLSQLPSLWHPIDISPFYSPTFLVV